MKRSALLALGILLAACGDSAPIGSEPEGLAMAESDQNITSSQVAEDVMVIEIEGERFELDAGICNTYDDGTFRFALAEGPVDAVGRGTATIERFDTGVGHEIIVAFEGRREDDTEVAWYARGNVSVHELTVSIFGSALEGTAVFDSIGGPDAPGEKAEGAFAIRCA
ncbi:MAG: hypothetical protein R8J94_04855 [Acidimicrobiia bacterium]|nr:hypothetical protein [Acidimicrobiia bacterium]